MSASEDRTNLHDLGRESLERATDEGARRAARGAHIAASGRRAAPDGDRPDGRGGLSERESPGPATLLVIRGRVRLVAGDETVELRTHKAGPIPNRRHSLHADEDSVVLLSVAVPGASAPADRTL